MKTPLKILSYVALCGVLFAGGFISKDLRQGNKPSVSKIGGNPPGTKTPTETFSSEYRRIQQSYALPVDSESLLYAGLEGALSSLGDPHTNFLEPVIAQEFEDSSMGRSSFGGIGARLMPDPMGVKVTQVFKGSPAEKAGVRGGDIIMGVNGETVAGQESDEIVDKIKGEIGTKVTLELYRGANNRVKISATRARITPPSADGNMIEGTKFGYLLVTGFEAPTSGQFARAIADLERQGMKGLVIDLRNNPGGLLEAATEMLSLFVDYKTAVTMEQRGGRTETVMTYGGKSRKFNYPITILLNEGSASAAEIFGGVMRDYGKATLIGEHTYGKASVQNVLRVTGGGSVKVTIAHYKLPSGKDISRKVDEDGRYLTGGIKPDVEVKLNLGPRVAMGDAKTDNQLQKAIEIMTAKQRSIP